MCYQQRSLQSGAKIGSKKVAHTYETRVIAGNRTTAHTREGAALVPMASVIDTTGAASAAEVWKSKKSMESWRRQRPMTESEYQEYQALPSPQRGLSTPGAVQPVLNYGGGGVRGNNNRGMVAQPLLITPSSYQEYLEATERPAPASRPSRLGVGGGTRSTGLGY
jgi:hypothetical protein